MSNKAATQSKGTSTSKVTTPGVSGGKQLVKAGSGAAANAIAAAKPVAGGTAKPRSIKDHTQDHRVIERHVDDPSLVLKAKGKINGDIRDVRKTRWTEYQNGVVVSEVLAKPGFGKNAHNELNWYAGMGIVTLHPAGTKVAKNKALKGDAPAGPKSLAEAEAAKK